MHAKGSLVPATLLLAATLLGGCGATADRDKFLGAWSYKPTTYQVSCSTGSSAISLSGVLTIKGSPGDDGITVLDAKSCNFNYSVKGSAATAAKRTCSFPTPELGTGVTATTTYDSITLLTADGATMTDTFVGTVDYQSSAGTLPCTFNGTATLER